MSGMNMMEVVNHLYKEPNSCWVCRILNNHVLRAFFVTAIIVPAIYWFLLFKKFNFIIPEFWMGAYASFVSAYIGFLCEQNHQLRVKWYRALVELEMLCYDLWNRTENERAKIWKCFEIRASCYEFPPDLTLSYEIINSLGRISIKNAAFRVRWLAEDISNSLKLLALTLAESKISIPFSGIIEEWFKKCDEKAALLQDAIVELQKSIKHFLDNDRPTISIPPWFSKRKWKKDMVGDPHRIQKELTSQFQAITQLNDEK